MLRPDLPEAFGLANGVMPILALVGLTIALPARLSRWIGTSQARLVRAMLVVGALVILAGALLLAYLTLKEDATARLGPLDLILRSLRLAIGWGPVWLLVWLVRAQGIEKRKALTMGRDDEDEGGVG